LGEINKIPTPPPLPHEDPSKNKAQGVIFKRKSDNYCCQGEYGQPYAPCGLFVDVLSKLN
jgi:hypothetical protein